MTQESSTWSASLQERRDQHGPGSGRNDRRGTREHLGGSFWAGRLVLIGCGAILRSGVVVEITGGFPARLAGRANPLRGLAIGVASCVTTLYISGNLYYRPSADQLLSSTSSQSRTGIVCGILVALAAGSQPWAWRALLGARAADSRPPPARRHGLHAREPSPAPSRGPHRSGQGRLSPACEAGRGSRHGMATHDGSHRLHHRAESQGALFLRQSSPLSSQGVGRSWRWCSRSQESTP